MRIGVLADIHGNQRALAAVQADLQKYSPDVVVNLGDHLSGPLQAAATADALISEKYLHIRGNHDRQLLDRPVDEMGASDRAAYAQLENRHKVWLQSLPPKLEIERDIFLCHGSPGDDLQYLLIVNPGSVGLPAYNDTRPLPHCMETGSPHARYAVIDREKGSWRVNLLAVEYDWSAASEDARKGNRPDWAHAIASGFALRTPV